jgi:hypothetical protein
MSEPSGFCTILRCCSMTWNLGSAKFSFRLLPLLPMLHVYLTDNCSEGFGDAVCNGWVDKPGPHHNRTTAAEYDFVPWPGRSPDTSQGCWWRHGAQSTMATEHRLGREEVGDWPWYSPTRSAAERHRGFHKVGTHQDPLGLFSSRGGGVHREGQSTVPPLPAPVCRLERTRARAERGKGGEGKQEILKSELSPVGVPSQLPGTP